MATVEITQVPDTQLAEQIGRRTESAQAHRLALTCFEELYRRHAPLLLAFLSARTAGRDHEDAHQNLWLTVWDRLPSLFDGGNFRAWLYTIARNLLTDLHRRRRRESALPGGQGGAGSTDPAAALLEGERTQALADCLQRLDPLERTVITSLLAGETYADVCASASIDHNAAYKTTHRAKAKLKACIERKLQ